MARLPRLPPGGDSLARPGDRLRVALLHTTAVLVLLLVPVMLPAGSAIHDSVMARSEQQARNLHRTVAVTTEDALRVGPYRSEPLSSDVWIKARWQDTAGVPHTGRVPVDRGTRPGDEVTVWLDGHGRAVDRPIAGEEAAVAAGFVAVTGWLAAAGLLALACHVAMRWVDRRGLRAWQEEWTRVEPMWRKQFR